MRNYVQLVFVHAVKYTTYRDGCYVGVVCRSHPKPQSCACGILYTLWQALLGSLYSSALISYVINGGYLFIKSLAIQCCNVSCSGIYIHVHKKIHACVNAT